MGARLAGYAFEGIWVTFSGSATTIRRDILGVAPSVRYSITGIVRNANGVALRGMSIFINNQSSAIATTDASGRFAIKDRPQNTYIVSTTINGVVVAVKAAVPAATGATAPNADIVLQAKPTTTVRSYSGSIS
ncbi:carboxypeptidase regulatory-like domain-containing protein [bacterium]|nr:MAG: carboxypeptidase regulatory-like domain-containing protein [bacterium]